MVVLCFHLERLIIQECHHYRYQQLQLQFHTHQVHEPDGYGTGAAVADIDNDGILELLVSRGESKEQPLTLYKAKVNKQSKYLRIKPINKYGAPARGATVTLLTNQRKHSKTIDAGSGYLCQMEPVAHYGIRKNEKNFKVEVKWTDGTKNLIKITSLNQTVTVKQK